MIVETDRRFEIFNWLQHFDPETISAEVEDAGLRVSELLSIFTGDPWTPEAGELAVIARHEGA